MLEAALRYPVRGDRGLERLLIGGVLLLLSVFLVPVFLVYGYLVRCLAAVAAGEEEPPPFDDWAGLFVDGIRATVVAVVYSLVPFGIVVGLLVLLGVAGVAGGNRSAGLLAGLGVVGGVVVLVSILAVAYLVLAGLSHLAATGRLAAAFDIDAVWRLATSGPYLAAILLAIAVQMVLGAAVLAAIVFTLGLALLVLVPLGAFINFWVYLVVVYLFGAAYREALGPASTAA